ncbi:MAG: FCD domain-containing protein [Planctomycetaceae bacterium]|nr:FCD domain-containing protein [Planctomycetaceae bacterium]
MPFEKVKQVAPKVSELVMHSILKAIDTGTIEPGGDLLPERDLAVELGVGRGSLRECLAILEFLGVIESRGNRKVVVKTAESARKALSVVRVAEQEDLGPAFLEFRRFLESAIVPLACERGTAEDFRALHAGVDAMAQDLTDADADRAFHAALARASHNPLFAALLDLADAKLSDLRVRLFRTPGNPEKALAANRALGGAVVARDKRAAKRELDGYLRLVEAFALAEKAGGPWYERKTRPGRLERRHLHLCPRHRG